MKKTDFDHYVGEYENILTEQLQFFNADNRYFAEYKVRKARKFFQHEPGSILDFGCGIGRSTAFLTQYFPSSQVYGCDTSEKSLIEARSKNPSAIFLNNAEIHHANIRFDFIFLSGVLHHVAPIERNSLMKSIANLLNENASVFIFEHNPFNPVTRHLVKTCPFDSDAVLLKPNEMKRLLIDAGLKQIHCEYTLFFPEMLKWLRPLEYYLRFFPLGGQYFMRCIR